VSLADRRRRAVLRTTDALPGWTSPRTVATQIEAGATLPYGKFLNWRGMVSVEPPDVPSRTASPLR